MCWIASVCCCIAENCWAKPSTVSPNSSAWEMGASRKRALSTSFISARLSQRWCSWTTMVDIAFPRDRVVTLVTHRAKSVTVRSSCINPGSVLPSCTCLSALTLDASSGRQHTSFGRETWTVPPSGSVSWAQVYRDRSLHLGNARVPPGSPAVEGSEDGGDGRALLAVKGAIHDFISSSCTSGKKGTGAEHGCEPRPTPRNQSSSREGSGLGGLMTSNLIQTAARASMAVSSGSGAVVATTPEGGSPTAPSSSENVSPSPDAAIDIRSADGAPNEMLCTPWDEPAKSPGNWTGRSLREE